MDKIVERNVRWGLQWREFLSPQLLPAVNTWSGIEGSDSLRVAAAFWPLAFRVERACRPLPSCGFEFPVLAAASLMASVGFISQWVTTCLQVGCFDWNQLVLERQHSLSQWWHPLAPLGLLWSPAPPFPCWQWVGGARVSESSLCVAWDWLLMLTPEKPVLGSCWMLGATSDAPAEVRLLTKRDWAALGFWGLRTEDHTKAHLGMETVSTIN